MWSMGCIFGELINLKPLFFCKNEQEALDIAFRMLGTPNERHVPSYLKLEKFSKY
jgi:hypothetical protein